MNQINRLILGAVGNSDAASEVHELDLNSEPVVNFFRDFEDHAGRLNEEIGVEFVGRHHRVQAEAFDAPFLKHGVAFEQLFAGEPILGFLGVTDNRVSFAQRPRVVSE